MDVNISTLGGVSGLAALAGTSVTFVEEVLNDARSFYEEIEIPKRSPRRRGQRRTVVKVDESLRLAQHALLNRLDNYARAKAIGYPTVFCHGFVVGRGIITNAREHVGAPLLLRADIKGFFRAVSMQQIVDTFEFALGLQPTFAEILAKFLTFNNRLAEGICTSPLVANLVCLELDKELGKLASNLGCRYTRYADDLAFSGERVPNKIGLSSILARHGFEISSSKFRVTKPGQSHYVTGLSISDPERPRAPRNFKKRIRQELHFCVKYGLRSHLGRAGYSSYQTGINSIDGRIRFLKGVEPRLAAVFDSIWSGVLRKAGASVSYVQPPSTLGLRETTLFVGYSSNNDRVSVALVLTHEVAAIRTAAEEVLALASEDPYSSHAIQNLDYTSNTERQRIAFSNRISELPIRCYVATAKHGDDSASSMFFRLLRGLLTDGICKSNRLQIVYEGARWLSDAEFVGEVKSVAVFKNSTVVRKARDTDPGFATVHYILGIYGDYLREPMLSQEFFERLRSKYHLIFDLDKNERWHRRRPLKLKAMENSKPLSETGHATVGAQATHQVEANGIDDNATAGVPSHVFISYTQESEAHSEQALSLANRLRNDGVDCNIDQYIHGTPPEGWPLWVERQLERSDFVLVVCTETNRRRWAGEEERGKGLGATWEAVLARQDLYDGQGHNTKFVPILFDENDGQDLKATIPKPLRAATYYKLPSGYKRLYRFLTGQPEVIPMPLGRKRLLPPNRPSVSSSDTENLAVDFVENDGTAQHNTHNRIGLRSSVVRSTPLNLSNEEAKVANELVRLRMESQTSIYLATVLETILPGGCYVDSMSGERCILRIAVASTLPDGRYGNPLDFAALRNNVTQLLLTTARLLRRLADEGSIDLLASELVAELGPCSVDEQYMNLELGDESLARAIHDLSSKEIYVSASLVETLHPQQPTPSPSQLLGQQPAPQRRCDVLILTATATETKAVLQAAQAAGGGTPSVFHKQLSYYDLGTFGGAQVLIAQSGMGSSGPDGSLLSSTKAIQDVAPCAILMTGIAFGVDNQKQALGEVLVATQLQSYEMQRVGTDADGFRVVLSRGDKTTATTRVLQRLRAASMSWNGPQVSLGLFLSGEKLVDNFDFREQLRDQFRDAVGGDMEGTGLYAACHGTKTDWGIVKAICDWADGNKHEDKANRQQVAAKNAAEFVFATIVQGGFSPETP